MHEATEPDCQESAQLNWSSEYACMQPAGVSLGGLEEGCFLVSTHGGKGQRHLRPCRMQLNKLACTQNRIELNCYQVMRSLS